MTQIPGSPVPKPRLSFQRTSPSNQNYTVTPGHISPGKRVAALICDFIACYLVGLITAMLPFVGKFVTFKAGMVIFWLIKDFLFGGRGIGKNLMGLRVVDMVTGGAPTLAQSVIRNIILIAPFAVLEILNVTLPLLHVSWIDNLVMGILNIVGMLYVIFVLPMEAYRAYSRPDSMRKGDELAGTCIVEAPMDFSNLLSK